MKEASSGSGNQDATTSLTKEKGELRDAIYNYWRIPEHNHPTTKMLNLKKALTTSFSMVVAFKSWPGALSLMGPQPWLYGYGTATSVNAYFASKPLRWITYGRQAISLVISH